MEKITVKQAYIAMYIYLTYLQKNTKSDDLEEFLGSMAIMENGLPVDGTIWDEWLDSVEKAKDDNNWDIAKFKLTKE